MGVPQTAVFATFQKQLDVELHNLASESKKKSTEVRHACDKSIKILKTVHTSQELARHPDFVVPFTLACATRNAKLTTIALQSLYWLSSVPCVPKERLNEVLDGFIEATYLAMDIQLKVLQVVPIFFKTYARYVNGPLVSKLLQCCSNLFNLPARSSMVASTASATMQQLVDEIFERLSYDWSPLLHKEGGEHSVNEMEELHDIFPVLVNNDTEIKINRYRYDANRLFANLISLMDSNRKTADSEESSIIKQQQDILIGIKEIPIDYGLEILESILKNNEHTFLKCPDLQFLLRIKAIPLLLRCVSTPKNFPIVVRSYRCIKLLLRKEYLKLLELELEVIFSILIHAMSPTTNCPPWQRVLSLELFNDVSNDFEMITEVFLMYDNVPDKKSVVASLLKECISILKMEDVWNMLSHSELIEKIDMTMISKESSLVKTQFLLLLDKSHAPSINVTYIIWLILHLSNQWSEELSELALKSSSSSLASVPTSSASSTHSSSSPSAKESYDNTNTTIVYKGIFNELFELNKIFLYSGSVETHLFHSLVRSFQKLTHGAGILSLNDNLNKCLSLFSKAIVNNSPITNSLTKDIESKEIENEQGQEPVNENIPNTDKHANRPSDKQSLHPRILTSKHVSLFRALISLSISLGSIFDIDSWRHIFLTWQWVSYYIYGPSIDFMECYYSQDVPMAPSISKNDVNAIELGVLKLFEGTPSYSTNKFKTLISSLTCGSDKTIFKGCNFHPSNSDGTIVSCIYNKGFYVTQLGEITTYNYSRFVSGNRGKECWWQVMDYFVKLIADRKIGSASLRLYITRIFTDIIKSTSEEITSIEDETKRAAKFLIIEPLIMSALLKSITDLSKLSISKNDIYQGVVTTEAETLLQLLSTLKGILNEFGDLLTTSWLTVFDIINSPFEFLKEDENSKQFEDQDDSSLFNAISQKRIEMIQVSYDVFKLISDDFLQTLPLDTIRYVISTLVNYIDQDKILNISFSSISQFWLVGDYLRMQFKAEYHAMSSDKFEEKVNNGKLMEVITSKDSDQYDFYNGLWIYLLESLVACSKDRRIEVKNGAIKTFFRIIDSHANFLPTWDLIFTMVLKPLLIMDFDDSDLIEYVEFYNISVSGLVNLYPLYFKTFEENSLNAEAWLTFLNFIQKLLASKSTTVKFVAISNFQKLLQGMLPLENIPNVILKKCHELWVGYNIVYNDSPDKTSVNSKSEYDCVYELISGFPHLYQLVEKQNYTSFKFLESSFNLFSTASRFPLLPPYSKDKRKPSTLQDAILTSMEIFKFDQPNDIELLMLYQLSLMSVLMLDTREKIMKKLAPKLSKTNINRIPTFEAISYKATQLLCDRLDKVDTVTIPSKNENQILKIINNLNDIMQKKLLIDLSESKETPMWVLASRSLRKLSTRLFSMTVHEKLSSTFKNEFHRKFIDAVNSTIKRVDIETDNLTEVYDIMEFISYKTILIDDAVIQMLDEKYIKLLLENIWSTSFLYQLDEIEHEFIDKHENLSDSTKELANFEFTEIFGSTIGCNLLSKNQCSQACLQDLIKFQRLGGHKYQTVRNITSPYLASRVALVLRRYIADENITGRAPIPKSRKVELITLLNGLCDIMDDILAGDNIIDHQLELENLLLLYPLILKTIPVSHKVDGLQDIVLKLSLGFTKLMSYSNSK